MNTQSAYNRVARTLHWGMGLCYVLMFATAAAWNINDNLKFLMNPHRAIGVLLLVLTIFRVIWAFKHTKYLPARTSAMKLGHGALYFFMLAVPITGMVRQAGFMQNNQTLIESSNSWHGAMAWVFLLLVAGHIGMVVVHHIKGERILERMLWK